MKEDDLKEIKSIEDIEKILNDFDTENKPITKNSFEIREKSGLKVKKSKKREKQKKEKKTALEKWSTVALIFSIITAVVAILPLLSVVITLGVIMILAVVLLLSLLTLLLHEGFMNTFKNVAKIAEESAKLLPYSPYILFGASGFMAISLLLTCLSKNKKTGVIVAKSIFLGLMIIAGIVFELLKGQIQIG